MSRRRVHPDLEALAATHPELCRDATAWGEARATNTEMRRKWNSIDRVAAELYANGIGVSKIGRILAIERRNVYRELYRWIERTSGIHHRPPDSRA